MNSPNCPKCDSEYTYADGPLFICPTCSHEWPQVAAETADSSESDEQVYRDAFGNILKDGDSVSVIKDLKIGGSSDVVKIGTKVKGIRLVDNPNGHNIDCKIPGFGSMQLKSEFVKKI